MSFLDKIKQFLSTHDTQVDQALGKAGDLAKGRFRGHEGQIDGLVGKARDMTGGGDTTRSAPPAPGAPPVTPPAQDVPPRAEPGPPAPERPLP